MSCMCIYFMMIFANETYACAFPKLKNPINFEIDLTIGFVVSIA